MHSPNRIQVVWQDPQKLKLLLGLLVGLLGFLLNLGIPGTLTLDWQHLYRPEDFKTWSDWWTFMEQLQTGISPFWASLEIGGQLVFGSTAFFSYFLYPFAIGLNAYWAITLFAQSRWQIGLAAGLSFIFVIAIRFIHKGNPQMYDMLMPALILAWLAVLKHLQGLSGANRKLFFWTLLAGLVLSVLELSRTLIFPLMPFFIFLSFLGMRTLPRRSFLSFLLPIVLLSGSWHLKQHLQHDQWHWSNHDGFNMQKSWVELAEPLSFDDDPPLYAGGFKNINTDKHTAFNHLLQKRVRQVILAHPVQAMQHLGEGLLKFYAPKTTLFGAQTPWWFDLIYRPAIWFCGLSVLLSLCLRALKTLRGFRLASNWWAWGQPLEILKVMILLISCVFAVGEVGEEARFMISILPLLAAAAPGLMGSSNKG